ncbi:MAG: phosphomannomutase [Gammaproteobacteria bacterium]|nr:phosphomannomutase [Gammaproteobacteria bacterium]
MSTEDEILTIDALMQQCGVQFGTSGARGLAEAMTDRVCFAYTSGFLGYLAHEQEFRPGSEVAIAGDFRASTPRIMAAAAGAVRDRGGVPVNLGSIPTPALALYSLERKIPGLMVTGSHIPEDRNGIKFYKAAGEVLKPDESGIRRQRVHIPEGVFDAHGMCRSDLELPVETDAARRRYCQRYLDFFPAHCLHGKRIGLYQHSSVARGLLYDILEGLGAEVIRLGYSDSFIPVDTEAIRAEDVALARQWAQRHELDALVSTDGDGDRPLIGDETGAWMRGDVAGVLCARYLGIRCLVTPVSSNSLVERCAWFERIQRTRIGSPYVIEAMNEAVSSGRTAVAGYEANGGFLLADEVRRKSVRLSPLPTRDAVIVILSVLMLAQQLRRSLSALVSVLPRRYTFSDRLKEFPTELSRARIESMNSGGPGERAAAVEAVFADELGAVEKIDATDGLRVTFVSGEVVHLRPSGNAPELRCYTEADSPERAAAINRRCIEIMEGWRR